MTAGCSSAFPPGAFDAGRGAARLQRDQTRISAGGGGGGALLGVPTPSGFNALPLVGGGGGVRVESQRHDEFSLFADVAAGAQTGGLTALIVPAAVYVGTQYNPGAQDDFALRSSVGLGVDTLSTEPSLGGSFRAPDDGPRPAFGPYGAATVEAVLSRRFGGLEPWVSARAGARVGAVTQRFSPPIPTFSASTGLSLGAAYSFTDVVAAYAVVRGDALLNVIFPVGVASGQVGVAFTF
jgi:hypothetical protein